MPLISVIIAAYRAEKTLARAICSLQAQTYRNWEALVVDDASTDDTWNLVESLAASDHRIRAFKLEQNVGPGAARNMGLDHARGDWITVLDADDAYLPTRLETLFEVASNGGYNLVFDNLAKLPTGDEPLTPFWSEWERSKEQLPLCEMLYGCSGAARQHYGSLKFFGERAFIVSSGVRYDPTLRRGEDVLFHCSLMIKGAKTARASSIGYLYDVPDLNSTTNASNLNYDDSVLVTLKLREIGNGKLNLAERAWLQFRLIHFTQPAEWVEFRRLLKNRCRVLAARHLAKNPSLIGKLFFELLKRVVRVFK